MQVMLGIIGFGFFLVAFVFSAFFALLALTIALLYRILRGHGNRTQQSNQKQDDNDRKTRVVYGEYTVIDETEPPQK